MTRQQRRLTGPWDAGTQQLGAPDATQPALPEPHPSTVLRTSNSRGSQHRRLRTDALHKKESRDSDQTEAACPGHLAPPGTDAPPIEPSSLGAPAPFAAAGAPLLQVSAPQRAAAVASVLQKLLGAAPSAEPAQLLAMLQSLLEPR